MGFNGDVKQLINWLWFFMDPLKTRFTQNLRNWFHVKKTKFDWTNSRLITNWWLNLVDKSIFRLIPIFGHKELTVRIKWGLLFYKRHLFRCLLFWHVLYFHFKSFMMYIYTYVFGYPMLDSNKNKFTMKENEIHQLS